MEWNFLVSGWCRGGELSVALRKPPTVYFPCAFKVADHSFAFRAGRQVSIELLRGPHLLEPVTKLGIGLARRV